MYSDFEIAKMWLKDTLSIILLEFRLFSYHLEFVTCNIIMSLKNLRTYSKVVRFWIYAYKSKQN